MPGVGGRGDDATLGLPSPRKLWDSEGIDIPRQLFPGVYGRGGTWLRGRPIPRGPGRGGPLLLLLLPPLPLPPASENPAAAATEAPTGDADPAAWLGDTPTPPNTWVACT